MSAYATYTVNPSLISPALIAMAEDCKKYGNATPRSKRKETIEHLQFEDRDGNKQSIPVWIRQEITYENFKQWEDEVDFDYSDYQVEAVVLLLPDGYTPEESEPLREAINDLVWTLVPADAREIAVIEIDI